MTIRSNGFFAVVAAILSTACAGSQGSKSNSAAGTDSIGGETSGGKTGSGGGGKTGSSGETSSSSGAGAGPMEVPPRSPPGSCGLDHPAFCEEFETKSPGGRGGDLDESVWSFSRWGHETSQHFVRIPSSQHTGYATSSLFCGKPYKDLLMPNDVQICDGTGVNGLTSGQLNEVYDDQGDFALNSFRSRQLFDFTDRTGTVVFDVDAKVNPLNIGHGWWVEFWITEDSAPMPYHEAPTIVSYPRAGLGINFQGLGSLDHSCTQGPTATSIARVFVSKDYKIIHDYPGWEIDSADAPDHCFDTADQKLNHFEIRVNKDQVEIWASDAGSMSNFHRLATAKNLDLPFTRGYVHFQHSAYNAPKDGNASPTQTYRWDNIGFDGPAYAMPRVYEVPDNDEPDFDGVGGRLFGHYFKSPDWISLTIKGVDLANAAAAQLDFNVMVWRPQVFQYRLNGGAAHDFQLQDFGRSGLGAYSLPLALGELKDGDNKLEVKLKTADSEGLPEYFGNAEIAITASK
jgi:hypothetical protein